MWRPGRQMTRYPRGRGEIVFSSFYYLSLEKTGPLHRKAVKRVGDARDRIDSRTEHKSGASESSQTFIQITTDNYALKKSSRPLSQKL